jgi:hypothetical protein
VEPRASQRAAPPADARGPAWEGAARMVRAQSVLPAAVRSPGAAALQAAERKARTGAKHRPEKAAAGRREPGPVSATQSAAAWPVPAFPWGARAQSQPRAELPARVAEPVAPAAELPLPAWEPAREPRSADAQACRRPMEAAPAGRCPPAAGLLRRERIPLPRTCPRVRRLPQLRLRSLPLPPERARAPPLRVRCRPALPGALRPRSPNRTRPCRNGGAA